jgi:hypothetical protein
VAADVGKDLGLELCRESGDDQLINWRARELTPSLQRASQSLLDCSEAAGLVTSMSEDLSAVDSHGDCAAEIKRTVNTKLIKRLSDLDLGLEVEVSVGELLALTECALCT